MAKGMIEWEYTRDEGLAIRLKSPSMGLENGEIRKHAMAAQKEILLTLRSLIDVAVKRTEEKEDKTEKRGTKIEVS